MSDLFTETDRLWRYRPVLWLVVAFIGIFFWWASTTEIEQHVRGAGRVVPAGKLRTIQHLEGGIIQDILVEEGQSVERGQVLFTVSNKRAQSELEEFKIAREALRIKQLRLEAELKNADRVDYDRAVEREYPGIVESERQLFHARQSEFREKMEGIKKRMQQKTLKLDEMQTNIRNLDKELAVASEQLKIKTRLRNSGAISRSQYLEAESAVKNFETRIARIQKEIPITKTELSELVSLLEETRQNWFSTVGEELNGVKVDIKKLNERIQALQDEVTRRAITSPIRGVVNKRYVNTIGGVIQPGESLAEIIPVDETLIVEGRISTDDRGKVWPGLDVVAKITAYDYSIYGGVKGKLTYISADSFIDNNNKEFYAIRVELSTNNLANDKPIFPGMTAELNILASKVSVLHVLLKPFWRTQENALREL